MNGTVLVAGGTGVLGSQIARLLGEVAPTARVLLGVHRRRPPDGAGWRRWAHGQPHTQRQALRGVDVLIDAAGPYTRDPTSTIRACVESGVHYVDLAECPVWLQRARAAADDARTSVVPGASTVPGIIEILTAARHRRGALSRVDVDLCMASGQAPGRGMLLGLLGPLGRRLPDGARAFVRLERRRGRLYGSFPCPPFFAGSPGAADGTFCIGFDRRAWTAGLFWLALLTGRVPSSWLRPLATCLLPISRLAARLGSAAGQLDLEIRGARGRVAERVTVHVTTDPLAVPALPAVLVCVKLLVGLDLPHGFASAADLVSRARLVHAIERRGGAVETRYACPTRKPIPRVPEPFSAGFRTP